MRFENDNGIDGGFSDDDDWPSVIGAEGDVSLAPTTSVLSSEQSESENQMNSLVTTFSRWFGSSSSRIRRVYSR